VKVLIIGGTSFVGRAISWSAWHHGHDITVLNRGITPNDLPETIERLNGERQGDLSALKERTFDVTIDVTAYRPSDVERLADALDTRGGHYVQISSVSAYENPGFEGATEATASLWPKDSVDPESPMTNEAYGPLKSASERAGTEFFGESATMIRPTFVIGSFDATLRFPYWVERLRRGGVVAVPTPNDHAMQYIDARDLASFVVRVSEERLPGAFHVAGPQPPYHFIDMIEGVAARVAPSGTELREVTKEQVRAARLRGKFPLWSGSMNENALALDSSLALSHGLDLRPLEDSVDDVLEWWGDREWPEQWLTNDDETRLLKGSEAQDDDGD
jgi:2'-hydroxyisoflavone reductase